MINTKYFVIDVESIGLYGEGFAVGWACLDLDEVGTIDVLRAPGIVHIGLCWCDPRYAMGSDTDREWVNKNIPISAFESLPAPNFSVEFCKYPGDVRVKFLQEWDAWRRDGYQLAADCPFPVETNFLMTARNECPSFGTVAYPLIDVGSVLLGNGRDPIGTYPRNDMESPAHHPTRDALQSARLMRTHLLRHSIK